MFDLVPLGMALYAAKSVSQPLEWTIDGHKVRVNVEVGTAAVAAQTKGILGYLERVCGVRDPALTKRLSEVRAIYGLTASAALDPQLATDRFWQLARELDALVFHRGQFLDAAGVVLAAPRASEREDAEDDEDDFDEEDDLEDDAPAGPPTAERVAKRVAVLAAIGARALLERGAHDDAREQLEALRTWVEEQELEGELEEEEQGTLFEPTIGGMGRQERIDAMWRFEGAALLAWALGLLDLPPHDTVVEVKALLPAVGVCRPLPPGLVTPVLRPIEAIRAMRERLFSIHWRLVDFRVRPAALDFPEVARRSTFGLVTDAAMLVGTDLGVRGRPLAQAEANDVALAASIAKERHQAANWLVGDVYGPTYSRVGTDT